MASSISLEFIGQHLRNSRHLLFVGILGLMVGCSVCRLTIPIIGLHLVYMNDIHLIQPNVITDGIRFVTIILATRDLTVCGSDIKLDLQMIRVLLRPIGNAKSVLGLMSQKRIPRVVVAQLIRRGINRRRICKNVYTSIATRILGAGNGILTDLGQILTLVVARYTGLALIRRRVRLYIWRHRHALWGRTWIRALWRIR